MTLREKMKDGAYTLQELLPSENTLVEEFGRSRDTIRRAIGQLASKGYVWNVHGKGTGIIYRPGQQQSGFILGDIKNLKEVVTRNRRNYTTKVVCFAELAVDEIMRRQAIFPVGAQIYYVQYMRCVEGEALIIDHNYFLKDMARDLAPEIAERSTYECMENNLNEGIVTTKRKMTVECVNQIDGKYLDLEGYNCMTVVSSMTCSKEGVMFELTQSRRRPGRFVFHDLAHRTKQTS